MAAQSCSACSRPQAHCCSGRFMSSPAALPSSSRRRGWRWRQAVAAPRCSAAGGPGADLPLPRPRKPSQLEPSYWLTRDDALEAQLKALRHNNFPTTDHGIETLYKFAGFDPFMRTDYFGVPLDLGQFERYRRVMYSPFFKTLVGLSFWNILSNLEVAEGVWVARVLVSNEYRREERVYTFEMARREGGRYDGVWYTTKLLADGMENRRELYGVI